MKKHQVLKGLFLIGSLVLVFALSGCGGANNAQQPPANQPAPDGAQTTPGGDQAAPSDQGGETDNDKAAGTFDEDAAKNTIAQSGCAGCHGAELKGQGNAPDLTTVGGRLTEDQIFDILTNGTQAGMPGGLVSDENARKNLAAYLASQK
jgi:mono/diheme cytochrome c family protein